MNEQPDRPGETRFRATLNRHRDRRLQRHAARPPLDLRPTTPFEQQILAHYEQLRRDFDELKKQVDWLTYTILAAALALVLDRILN